MLTDWVCAIQPLALAISENGLPPAGAQNA
jgi:hypothetical protein